MKKYKLRILNKEQTLGVTIPSWVAEKAKIKPKDFLNIDIDNDKIIITKANKEE